MTEASRAPGTSAAGTDCPACGGEVVPVVFGYPGPEMMQQAEQGRVVLAGCAIPLRPEDEALACRACGRRLPGREAWGDGLLERAFGLAAEAHAGQCRKGTPVPYLSHPMAVASLVMGYGGTPVQAAAGLLHDVVEDSDLGSDDVRRACGGSVADVVTACTDADPAPGEPKAPWHERKPAYVARLGTVAESAILVVACDKLHNARSILSDHDLVGEGVWSRFSQPVRCTAWYYRAVGERLTARLRHPRLADEVAAVVGEVVERARAAAGDARCRLEGG